MKRILVSLSLLVLASASALAAPVNILMKTRLGDVTLELYPDKAPETVKNFLRYVDEGFYDGTIFHRVISGFMIQGGGYGPDLERKSTHAPVPNEADNGLKNRRGTIAMARTSDPHSATAQFFINLVDNDFLDFKDKSFRGWGYTVFGKVVDGMDIVDKIADVHTTSKQGMRNVPEQDIVIESIEKLGNDSHGQLNAGS